MIVRNQRMTLACMATVEDAAHLDWFHRYLGGGASPWDPRELARGASHH